MADIPPPHLVLLCANVYSLATISCFLFLPHTLCRNHTGCLFSLFLLLLSTKNEKHVTDNKNYFLKNLALHLLRKLVSFWRWKEGGMVKNAYSLFCTFTDHSLPLKVIGNSSQMPCWQTVAAGSFWPCFACPKLGDAGRTRVASKNRAVLEKASRPQFWV